MILGVHHIGMRVDTIAQTKWLDHLGGGPSRGSGSAWAMCPNVRIRLENADVKPGDEPLKRPVNLPGIAHLCLQSRDIDEGLARGLARGFEPISGPVDLGTEFRYLYTHTHDGILLEIEGAPFAKDEDPRFWIGHVAFVARDIEALVGFYGRVLALPPSPVLRLNGRINVDKVAGLDGVDLSAMWLPGFNLGLEFWQYHTPAAPTGQPDLVTGFTYICFESSDFSGDVAHFLDQGAVPDIDRNFGLANCQTAAFKDIEGNCFSLIGFDDPNDPMAIKNLPHRDILEHIAAQRPSVIKSKS